jgi:hypothetical protein
MRWIPLFGLLVGLSRTFSGEIFDVRDFGAKGDGTTLDTEAINNAIEAATVKADAEVHFPPGKYVTGTVELQSEMTLVLEPGSTLLGTTNLAAYKMFHPPAGTPEAGFKPEWHRALILGDKVEKVTITGGGVIDGNKVFDPKGEERMRGPAYHSDRARARHHAERNFDQRFRQLRDSFGGLFGHKDDRIESDRRLGRHPLSRLAKQLLHKHPDFRLPIIHRR